MAAGPLRGVLVRVSELHGCAAVKELCEHCFRQTRIVQPQLREMVRALPCDARCGTLMYDVLVYAARLVKSPASQWKGIHEGTLLYALAVTACAFPANDVGAALAQACCKFEPAAELMLHMQPLHVCTPAVKTSGVERVKPQVARQRSKELLRLLGILDRPSNFHVVLCGRRGVGRRTLVSGLSQYRPEVPMHMIHADALASPDLIGDALRDVLQQHTYFNDKSYTSLVCVTNAERVVGEAALLAAAQVPGLRLVLCVRNTASLSDLHIIQNYFTVMDVGEMPESNLGAIVYERFALPKDVVDTALRASKLVATQANPGCVLDMLCGFAGYANTDVRTPPLQTLRLCVGGDALASALLRLCRHGAAISSNVTLSDFCEYLDIAYNVVLPPEEQPVTPLATLQTQLVHIKQQLGECVYGQDDVCAAVTRVICQRMLLKDDEPDRPISLVFPGSTGVGKTTLAQALGRAFFGDPSRVVTLNMAEYTTSESSARLLGMHAGYIGYEDVGELTRIMSRTPDCLLLLDECEKAHKDLYRLFLSIMGEQGVIMDNRNNVLKFGKCIIVMTTNIGQDDLLDTSLAWPERVRRVEEKLTQYFSRELMGRVDNVCVFHPLSTDVLEKIGSDVIESCNAILIKYGTRIACSADTLRQLVTSGASARDTKRTVKRLIMARVSEDIVVNGSCPASYTLFLEKGVPCVK